MENGNFAWGCPYFAPRLDHPSPYLYQVLYTLDIAKGRLFHDHLVTIAEAHRKHPNGNIFICYGSWIGEGVITMLYPMTGPDEMKSWTPQEKILLDIYGADDGNKLIKDFGETLRGEERTVLQHLPEFSNIPDPPEKTAFDYVYHIAGTRSAHSRASEFRTLAIRAIEVNRTRDDGLRWITYGEHGATHDRFHIYLPFRKMATLDQWVDVLNNGQISIVDGEPFTQTLRCGVTDYRTYVHVHVSACDHSG
jgi:hypothetical protein